jgi:hypothetical protein
VPTAHATVATARPSRYLIQLCRHVDHLSRRTDHRSHLRQGDLEHTPPGPHARVTWSDTGGMIDLGWGQCTLTADDSALLLHAEARDDADLRRLQALLSARLHQIGRRDHLTVSWQPTPIPTQTPTPVAAAAAGRSTDAPGARRRRPHRGTLVLVVVGVLLVALHLGLAAATIAAPSWTSPALDLVFAVIVVKLLASVVLGRRVAHRRRRSTAAAPETSEKPRA